MGNIKHSSATAEHYTPSEIIEPARIVLGGIDLDPASDAFTNSRLVKAGSYFNAKQNGLKQEWNGDVLLNPPGGWCDENGRRVEERHGLSSQRLWWSKLVSEYLSCRVHSAIFIGFSIEVLQTTQVEDERYKVGDAYPLPVVAFPLCFPKTRIRFLHREGNKLVVGKQPTHANVIVYLPRREGNFWSARCVHGFSTEFTGIGACVWRS